MNGDSVERVLRISIILGCCFLLVGMWVFPAPGFQLFLKFGLTAFAAMILAGVLLKSIE